MISVFAGCGPPPWSTTDGASAGLPLDSGGAGGVTVDGEDLLISPKLRCPADSAAEEVAQLRKKKVGNRGFDFSFTSYSPPAQE